MLLALLYYLMAFFSHFCHAVSALKTTSRGIVMMLRLDARWFRKGKT